MKLEWKEVGMLSKCIKANLHEGMLRRRWEDNVRIDLKKIGCVRSCVDSAQGRNYWRRLVNAALNFCIP